MRTRSILIAASAAAVTVAMTAGAAQARPVTEQVNRSNFDATPELSAATLHIEGATSGELGGYLDVTATATDGSLPTAFGSCESVDVAAVLTVSPGEVLTVETTGEMCAHIIDGSLTMNAYFGNRDVTYSGTEHTRVRLVGDGLIAAANRSYGAQASFSGSFRW